VSTHYNHACEKQFFKNISVVKTTLVSAIGIAALGAVIFAFIKYTPILFCLCFLLKRRKTPATVAEEKGAVFYRDPKLLNSHYTTT